MDKEFGRAHSANMREALQNIFRGKSALGGQSPFKRPYFPNETSAIHKLAEACEELNGRIKDSLDLSRDKTLTAFLVKMANFAGKQGWTTAEILDDRLKADLPTIADAINESPQLVTNSKAGISAILRRHAQNARQSIATMRKELMSDPAAEPLLIHETNNGYKLVELLSPRQLQQQSVEIGGECCVGTSYNADLLLRRGLDEGDPRSEDCLTYAVKIRSGESRVFALKNPSGHSVVTIEYETKHKCISQIEGMAKKIGPSTWFLPDLCSALSYLKDYSLDLSGGIIGLPEIPDKLITKDGRFIPYETDIDLNGIFSGNIKINPDLMSGEEFTRLATSPDLTLDITSCGTDWLNRNCPPRIRGSLITQTQNVLEITGLEQVDGKFLVDNAKAVHLPFFKQSGREFGAWKAEEIHMPAFQRSSGNLFFNAAKKIHLPSFVHNAAGFCAWDTEEINMPVFSYNGGEFLADSLKDVNLPEFVHNGGHFHADGARTLKLSNLKYNGGDIRVTNAEEVCLSVLRKNGGDLRADHAFSLRAPVLEYNGGHLNANVAKIVALPRLAKNDGHFVASGSETIDLPELEYNGGHIRVDNAREVNFPKLKRNRGGFQALRAEKIVIAPGYQGMFPKNATRIEATNDAGDMSAGFIPTAP